MTAKEIMALSLGLKYYRINSELQNVYFNSEFHFSAVCLRKIYYTNILFIKKESIVNCYPKC